MEGKVTLGEQAYWALKNKIATLASGTYLSARQFATEIGMSYTPVREAFLRLQREGSLKQIPNVGFFVETMDLNEMVQSYQVRECIEPFVLQKVFHRMGPTHIQQMRKCIAAQEKALKKGSIVEYMKYDIELHEIMINLYGNPHFQKFYRSIREQYMFCSNKIATAYYPGAITEHKELADAIERGDLEAALQLMTTHIENAKQRMKEGYVNVIDD